MAGHQVEGPAVLHPPMAITMPPLLPSPSGHTPDLEVQRSSAGPSPWGDVQPPEGPRCGHTSPDHISAHPGTWKRRSGRKWGPFGKC